jgi:tRNA A37 methylthiotransferase MiaB
MPGQVPEEKKARRQGLIMEAQAAISDEINLTRAGTAEEVLIEGKTDRPDFPFYGRTRFQAPEIDGITYVKGGKVALGDFIKCRVTAAEIYDLYAERL